MRTSDLYSTQNECCGCELCAQSCPTKTIVMKEDNLGFLYPEIEEESTCINCNKCIRVCPMKAPGRNPRNVSKSFSYSLKDKLDLQRSASGGLATAISRSFIQNGGVVYGVCYYDDYLSIHFERADAIKKLDRFRGSKYAQASKEGIYDQIRLDLRNGRKVLFIGLPCEISAVYHAFGEDDNLYTVSLICHGPTSVKVHRDYCNDITKTNSSLSFFSVRYKLEGWKPYYIHAEYANGDTYNEMFKNSDYGVAFQYLKRPSCRTCRYKDGDNTYGLQSDLTIGDFHGVNQKSEHYNKWGVSQGSIQSEKGNELVSLLGIDLNKSEIPYSWIKLTNRGLFVPIPQRGSLKVFVRDYLNHSLHYACTSNMVKMTEFGLKIWNQIQRVKGIKRKIRMIIKRQS